MRRRDFFANAASLGAGGWIAGSTAHAETKQAAPKPANRAEATAIIADARKIVTPNGVEQLQAVRIGNWIGPISRGPEGDKFKDDELRSAAAVLLGRRTYDAFAGVWPTVKSEMANRMRALAAAVEEAGF